MYINHITLSTGHLSRALRSDVADSTLTVLSPWLAEIHNNGKSNPLPLPALSHYSAQCSTLAGSMVLTVCAPIGPHLEGRPHDGETVPLITLGVAQRSRQAAELWPLMVANLGAKPGLQMPGAPWCAVALHPGLAMHRGPTVWLGDFERCAAWAWITRNPSIGAA